MPQFDGVCSCKRFDVEYDIKVEPPNTASRGNAKIGGVPGRTPRHDYSESESVPGVPYPDISF